MWGGGMVECAYSPDGRWIASAAPDEPIRIWRVETGECKWVLPRPVHHVRWSPGGRRVLAGPGASPDSTIIVHDLTDGSTLHLESGAEWAMDFAWSPDGRWVATAGDRSLLVWDLAEGRAVVSFPTRDLVRSITFGPGGSIAADDLGHVYLLDLVGFDWPAPRATAVVLYLFDAKAYDAGPTFRCEWCGRRSRAPGAVVDAIQDLRRGQAKPSASVGHLRGFARRLARTGGRPSRSTALDLTSSAWEDPRLVAPCPLCGELIRFNPFIVDERGQG